MEYKSLLILECLNAGILPPAEREGARTVLSDSPKDYLDKLSPEDAHKAKRKFRKLHRKAKKQAIAKINAQRSRKGMKSARGCSLSFETRQRMADLKIQQLQNDFGEPGSRPNKNQKRNRRREVMEELWKKIPKK